MSLFHFLPKSEEDRGATASACTPDSTMACRSKERPREEPPKQSQAQSLPKPRMLKNLTKKKSVETDEETVVNMKTLADSLPQGLLREMVSNLFPLWENGQEYLNI